MSTTDLLAQARAAITQTQDQNASLQGRNDWLQDIVSRACGVVQGPEIKLVDQVHQLHRDYNVLRTASGQVMPKVVRANRQAAERLRYMVNQIAEDLGGVPDDKLVGAVQAISEGYTAGGDLLNKIGGVFEVDRDRLLDACQKARNDQRDFEQACPGGIAAACRWLKCAGSVRDLIGIEVGISEVPGRVAALQADERRLASVLAALGDDVTIDNVVARIKKLKFQSQEWELRIEQVSTIQEAAGNHDMDRIAEVIKKLRGDNDSDDWIDQYLADAEEPKFKLGDYVDLEGGSGDDTPGRITSVGPDGTTVSWTDGSSGRQDSTGLEHIAPVLYTKLFKIGARVQMLGGPWRTDGKVTAVDGDKVQVDHEARHCMNRLVIVAEAEEQPKPNHEFTIGDYVDAETDTHRNRPGRIVSDNNVAWLDGSSTSIDQVILVRVKREVYNKHFKVGTKVRTVTGDSVTGVVAEVGDTWNTVMLNDKWYDMSQLLIVGEAPPKPEPEQAPPREFRVGDYVNNNVTSEDDDNPGRIISITDNCAYVLWSLNNDPVSHNLENLRHIDAEVYNNKFDKGSHVCRLKDIGATGTVYGFDTDAVYVSWDNTGHDTIDLEMLVLCDAPGPVFEVGDYVNENSTADDGEEPGRVVSIDNDKVTVQYTHQDKPVPYDNAAHRLRKIEPSYYTKAFKAGSRVYMLENTTKLGTVTSLDGPIADSILVQWDDSLVIPCLEKLLVMHTPAEAAPAPAPEPKPAPEPQFKVGDYVDCRGAVQEDGRHPNPGRVVNTDGPIVHWTSNTVSRLWTGTLEVIEPVKYTEHLKVGDTVYRLHDPNGGRGELTGVDRTKSEAMVRWDSGTKAELRLEALVQQGGNNNA